MRSFVIFLFVLFFLLTPSAQAEDFKTEIEKAEILGRMIYEQDVAGWVATDALLSEKQHAETILPQLKGWVSLKDNKNYKTIFIGVLDGKPKALFEVVTKKRKVKNKQALAEGRDLTAAELARWRARQRVVSEEFEHCPQFTPMNTIVITVPNDPENRLYSYLFSATQQNGVIVFGKHYRFTLSEDASIVLDKKDFSKSCIGIERPADANAVGAVISHIMSPYPEEHHVFANLSQKLDIYVTIPETSQLWKVSNGKISKVKL